MPANRPLHRDRPRPDAAQRLARRALILAVAIERFASGLLTSLLVFQLQRRWGFSAGQAAAWVGYVLAASYITPLLGGVLCDRGLPARAACVLGCAGIALGYLALTSDRQIALLLGCGCLLVGAGLFRPGIQLLLDALCEGASATDSAAPSASAVQTDSAAAQPAAQPAPRRDEAYTWMHALVNVGGMLAPLTSEGLQQASGWSAVSAVAVGCMLFAIGLLYRGVPASVARGGSRSAAPRGQNAQTADAAVSDDSGCAPVHGGSDGLLSPGTVMMLCVALAGFWMVYAQCSSTLLLWAEGSVDRRVLGWTLPISVVAALPWALVVVLAPGLMALFRRLRARNQEPSTLGKLRLGFLAMAAGFFVLLLAALLSTQGAAGVEKAHVAWLVLALVAITVGELCVAPLGPVLLLLIAPRRLRGLVMALWFGTLGVGFVAGGAFSQLWGTLSPPWFFALACGLTLAAWKQV